MLIWCTHMFHFIWHNIHPHIIVCNRSRLTFSINIDLLTWHHFKSTINLLDSCGLGWTCFCRSAATWFYSLIGLHLTQPGLPLSGCSHLTLQSDWTRLDSTQLASVGVQPPDSTVWLDLTWLNPACLFWSATTWLYSLIGLDLTQPSLPLSECSHLTLQSDWTQLDSTQLDSVGGCSPLTGWMVCVSSPHRANRCLSCQKHSYQLRAHAAYYSVNTTGSFSVGNVASVWSWPLTILHLMPGLMGGAMPPLSLYVSVVCTGTALFILCELFFGRLSFVAFWSANLWQSPWSWIGHFV